jgi:hypothetical protein
VQPTIFDNADEVKVKDPIPRDPLLDDRSRPGDKYRYVLEFLGAFSKGPTTSPKVSAGFFKSRFKVVSADGEDAYDVGSNVTLLITPRAFDGHVKDIKALIAALTNTKMSQVSKANIAESVADNPDNGGAGELNGIKIAVTLERNKRGYFNMHFTALPQ